MWIQGDWLKCLQFLKWNFHVNSFLTKNNYGKLKFVTDSNTLLIYLKQRLIAATGWQFLDFYDRCFFWPQLDGCCLSMNNKIIEIPIYNDFSLLLKKIFVVKWILLPYFLFHWKVSKNSNYFEQHPVCVGIGT